MGASLSVSNADVTNKAINTTFQTASNACNADCSQTISGVDIILNNSTTGNITFTQKCTVDASCAMTNALEQVVSAYQLATAKADAQSPILPIGFQVNLSNASTKNEITSALTQVLDNQCKSDINQTIKTILIYATNSSTGDIGYLQEGDAKARCVMDNSARMQLSISQTGSATATSGSTFGGLIGLIILIVIIMAVIGAVSKARKDQQANQQAEANNPNSQSNKQFDTKRLASQYGGSTQSSGPIKAK